MRPNDTEKPLDSSQPSTGQLLKCDNFSSLHRLLVVTAKVLRFCQFLLSKICKKGPTPSSDDSRNTVDNWGTEGLVENKNFPLWKKQFDLFQDYDKVWRCRGQIQNASVSFSTKHPVLLHRTHFLSKEHIKESCMEESRKPWLSWGPKCGQCRRETYSGTVHCL